MSNGRSHGPESTDTVEQQMLFAAENAYRTLLGGVTTVQSIGAELDVDLRDAIARGTLPGPRILTSIRSVHEGIGGPQEIRRFVAAVASHITVLARRTRWTVTTRNCAPFH